MTEFQFPYVREFPGGEKKVRVIKVEAETYEEALEEAVRLLDEMDAGY